MGTRQISRVRRRQLSENHVHPIAVELLRQMRLPTAGLRSKSWDEFGRARRAFARLQPAREPDQVFTSLPLKSIERSKLQERLDSIAKTRAQDPT